MVMGSDRSIITLTVSGLNVPTKRQRKTGWAGTRACMHFHLPHGSTYPPNCVWWFYTARWIVFPLWLEIVIIFYFLSGYWLWKLINIFYYCDFVAIIHWIREGNGNPLQYSCLENPGDRGAWGLPSIGSHRVRLNTIVSWLVNRK